MPLSSAWMSGTPAVVVELETKHRVNRSRDQRPGLDPTRHPESDRVQRPRAIAQTHPEVCALHRLHRPVQADPARQEQRARIADAMRTMCRR